MADLFLTQLDGNYTVLNGESVDNVYFDGYVGVLTFAAGSAMTGNFFIQDTDPVGSPSAPSLTVEEGAVFPAQLMTFGTDFAGNTIITTGVSIVSTGAFDATAGIWMQQAAVPQATITLTAGSVNAGALLAVAGDVTTTTGDVEAATAILVKGAISSAGDVISGGIIGDNGLPLTYAMAAITAAGKVEAVGAIKAIGISAGTSISGVGITTTAGIIAGTFISAGTGALSVASVSAGTTVTAASISTGAITAGGAITTTVGDLAATGFVTAASLSVAGNATLAGTNVTGNIAVVGNVTGSASLICGGNFTAAGITLNDYVNLSVTGLLTTTGDVNNVSNGLISAGSLSTTGTVTGAGVTVTTVLDAAGIAGGASGVHVTTISGSVGAISTTNGGIVSIDTLSAGASVGGINTASAVMITNLAGTIGTGAAVTAVTAAAFQVTSSAATAQILGIVTLGDSADSIDFSNGGTVNGAINFGGGADSLKGGTVTGGSAFAAGSAAAAANLKLDSVTFAGAVTVDDLGATAGTLTLKDLDGTDLTITGFADLAVDNAAIGSVTGLTNLAFTNDGEATGVLSNVTNITVDGSLSYGATATVSAVDNISFSNATIALGDYALASGNTVGTTITIDALNNGVVMDYGTVYAFGSDVYGAMLVNSGTAITLNVIELFINEVMTIDQSFAYNFTISADIVAALGYAGYSVRFLDAGANDISASFSELGFNSEQKYYSLDDDTVQSFTTEVTFHDNQGNSKAFTFDKTVIDRSAPVVTGGFGVTQTVSAYTFDLTAGTYIDNFGAVPTLSYAIYDGATLIGSDITADFAAYAGRELTVVETAVDAAGNKTTQSQVITIADVTDPFVLFSSIVQQAAYTFEVMVTGTDNVGVDRLELTVTDLNGVVVPATIVYGANGRFVVTVADEAATLRDLNFEVTAFDKAGNYTAATWNDFAVADMSAPVIASPFDVSQASGSYSLIPTPGTYTDNDGQAPMVSYAIYDGATLIGTNVYADFAAYAGRELTVVETATDAAGNKTTQSQVITIADVTDPFVSINSIVQQAAYTFEVMVSGTDNVGVDHLELTVTDLNGVVVPATIVYGANGKFVVTVATEAATLRDLNFEVTAFDKAGNFSTATWNDFAVADITAPVSLGGFGVTQTANAYTFDLTAGTYDDNSGMVPTLSYAIYDGATLIGSDITGDFAAYAGRELTVVETATDAAGNKTTQSQVITIADVTDPFVSINSIVQQAAYTFEVMVTGYDNVGVEFLVLGVTDANGIAVQSALVFDNNGKFVVTVSDEAADLRNLNFEVIAIDKAGNSATDTWNDFVVADITAPVSFGGFGVTQTANAYTFDLTAGTYTDNSGNTTLSYAVYDGATLVGSDITGDFTAYAGRELTVVETATDAAGNKTTQSQVIMIADVTAPDRLAVTSVKQKSGYSFELAISGSDNLGIDKFDLEVTDTFGNPIAATLEPVNGNSGKFIVRVASEESVLGDLIFSITATDKAGNVSLPVYEYVVVNDVTAPVITGAFAVVHNQLLSSDVYTLDITAGNYMDNDTGWTASPTYAIYLGSTLIGTDITADFAAYVGKELTVVETVVDAAGNKTSQKATVMINDVTSPDRLAVTSVKQKDGYSFELAVSGSDNVGIDRLTLEVTDTFGNPIAAVLTPVNGNSGKFIVQVASEESALGDLIFTLYATDAAGNISAPVYEYVVVNDVTAPVITGTFAAAHIQPLNSGIYTLDFTAGSYLDNDANWTASPTYAIYLGSTLIGTDITADFAAYAGNELTVVETVVDAGGNKTSQKATVMINDVTSPDAPTVEIVKQDGNYGFNFSIGGADNLAVAWYELTITDQAGNVLESAKLQPAAGNRALFETENDLSAYAAEDLILTVRTWDKAGNENVTVLDLPVRDTTPPEITATSIVQKKAERPDESGFNFNVFVEASDNVTDVADLSYTVRVYSKLGANVAALYTFAGLVYSEGKVNFELNPVMYDTSYWYTIEAEDAAGNTSVTDFVAFTAASEMGDSTNPEKVIVPDANNVGNVTLTGDLVARLDTDTFKLTHAYAGLTTLVITGIDPGEKAKVTIVNSNGKKKTYNVSYGKNEIITGVLTNPGDSYLTIRSIGRKVNVANYAIQMSTAYFPGSNYDSPDSANALLTTTKADSLVTESSTDWVGYGDYRDYYKLTSECAGEYNIKVAADAGKVQVKFLNEAGRTIKTFTVGAGKEKEISALYYSKNKIDGQNVSYVLVASVGKGTTVKNNTDFTVTVTETVFNKGDNGQIVDLGRIGDSEVNHTDWLGYGDAQDIFAFQADNSGIVSLDFSKLDGSTDLDLNKIKVKLYDANGKSIALKNLGGSVDLGFQFESKKALLADSDYVLSVSIGNEKKQKADYNLAIAIN